MPGNSDWNDILNAIQQFEGVNSSYNNPGGIQYGNFAVNNGSDGFVPAADGGTIATFPDYETGRQAASSLISGYANQGLSLGQLVQTWTGGNGSSAYNNAVINAGGGNPNSLLSELQGKGSTASGSSSSGLSGSNAPALSDLFGGNTSTWLVRGASIAAGLILIGGGLLLFKPAQEVVGAVTRTAGKAAGAAARVAVT